MKYAIIIIASFLFAGIAFADDPGERDSIIIETIFVDIGDSTADLRIYATCDDTVAYYNMPLAWIPNSNNGIYPVDVSYFYPISDWDEQYDSTLYDEGFIRMMGWSNGGGPDPPLMTYNYRLHCWTVHFVIDPSAEPQIVIMDTTYDPINGSLTFGLINGIDHFTPEFIPGAIFYGVTSDIDNGPVLPSGIALLQNYPNPFNAQTTIEFMLASEAEVELVVYDLLGRKVTRLVKGIRHAGLHSVIWDAEDVPSGIYFGRLEADDTAKNIKMVLLK